MHITYDLPLLLMILLKRNNDWLGEFIKQACLAPTILVNVAKVKYS